MTTDAARTAFLKQLDEARRQPQRIGESEIARMAHQAGLPVQDSLREIRRSTLFNKETNTEGYDALVAFVTRLCCVGKSTRILEYTRIPSLLTAGCAESGASGDLRYILPDTHLAESLRILFQGRSASVLNATEGLATDALFDSIVCQPAIGYRSTDDDRVDGFGGEIVRELTPFLAEGGTLYWVTARGVLFLPRGQKTLTDLQRGGLHTIAVIDLAAGVFPGTLIEGTLIAFRRHPPAKRFVGALRDPEAAASMAAALQAGATKSGPSWTWLDPSDHCTFAQIEQSRLLRKLMPRGRHATMTFRSLLAVDRVEKADKPAPESDTAASYLFIPEYAGSRVTTDLDEQTVKPKAVYRFAIDPTKANPRFLAQLLNGPYGRELRAAAGQGATIQRISATSLLSLETSNPRRAHPRSCSAN